MNLIGLGGFGCEVVDKLKEHPQYSVYKIDHGLSGLKKNGIYNFPNFSSAEQYEEQCPSMKNFFKNISGEAALVVSGQDAICSATLRILETIKDRTSISIIYFKPDALLLDAHGRLLNNAAFNVFQEYARSGIFSKIYIVSQELLSTAIGEVPIIDYKKKTAEFVSFVFHIINVMTHSEPVYANFTPAIDIARICTFGMASIEEQEELLLFPIEYPKEKTYYYLIPEDVLNKDVKLMKKIMDQVKKRTEDGKIKINFGVYQSEYEEPFVYVVSSSSIIQGANYK